jgi:hypothetical protein
MSNMVGSVGILKRIPELLNILRKEGFARVHRQRKGDALNPSIKLREKSSKNGVEHKECTKDTVSSYYKSQEEEKKFPRGHKEVHRGTVNFEGFQAEKNRRRVCVELCKECKRSSRTTLSLERKICAKCEKGRGLVEVPKVRKSSIVRRRQVEEYREVLGARTSKGFPGETNIFVNCEGEVILDIGSRRHMVEIHVFQRKNPSKKSQGENTRRARSSEAILAIH